MVIDRNEFDRLSRVIATGTRRDALRLLLAGLVIGSTTRLEAASARKKSRGRSGRAQAEQALQCTTICLDCPGKKAGPGANLTRCDFIEDDLAGVNLGGANLTDACFARANLHNARFRGANVSGTCFCGADLTGADFRGTKVTSEQLACATTDCSTTLPDGKSPAPCAKGEHCCNGTCVNTTTDPNNCGACRNRCPATKADACTGGECTCGNGPACLQSTTCCAESCVDTETDPTNCGRCGNACGPCQTCQNGQCVAKPNQTFACDGTLLEQRGGTKCTTNPRSGVCLDGTCVCGRGTEYDEQLNICLCDATGIAACQSNEPPDCCQIGQVCIDPQGGIDNLQQCVTCF